MFATTPSSITPVVRKLCNRIKRGGEPLYVRVAPEPGARPDHCFSTVAQRVAVAGGAAVIGWTLWLTPYMAEGEFHAVWQPPEGELVDLTPKSHGETKILFLLDRSRTYDGKQVDNIRMPFYRNDLLVERFITVNEQIFNVLNRGERAHQHGHISVPVEEIAPLMLKKERLVQQITARRLGPEYPCVCGRARKLKQCCGKN